MATATSERSAPAFRGIRHPMHPMIVGAVIAMAGASAFVNVNRVHISAVWSQAAFVAWIALLATAVWAVFLRRRHVVDPGPPHPRAGLVYVGSVAGMVAGMYLGTLVAREVGFPHLQPAIIVACVGLHFVPFAWAFHAPIFRGVGLSLTAVGVIGSLLGLVAGATPPLVAAVVSGLVMLAFLTVDTLRSGPVTA